jgi:hypothetical protein
MVTTALVNTALPRQQQYQQPAESQPPYKKSKASTKKLSQARKKKQRLPPLLVYIELLKRSINRQKTLPTFPHHSADRKSTMPSSQPLYRTLHPINTYKVVDEVDGKMSRHRNRSLLYCSLWYFSNLPSSDKRQSGRCTPHHANDLSP